MKNNLIIIFLIVLCTSCSEPKPKVVYNNQVEKTENNTLIDTSVITIAGLPIHFDSTNFLIYPIGKYKPTKKESKVYLSSSRSESSGLVIAYKSGYSVSGNLDNLKFQHIDSSSFFTLTNKQMKIRSFTFLNSLFNSSRKQVLVYNITDKDSNKDKKLDNYDIESLYISDIDGKNFKKLSPQFQELIDWRVMNVQNRIYFNTSEDIDKNGEFNKSDRIHNYYVDLNNNDRNVIEYHPINK